MTIKGAVRTLQELFEAAKYCHKLAPPWGLGYPVILLWAIRLCHRQHFLPDEAFRLGLFNPTLPRSELSKYISRKKLTKVQKALNPIPWAPILRDKSIFYRYCMALGVPIPRLYAIFFKNTAGWSCNGSVLKTRDDWKRVFEDQLPSEFVIKPAQGACGHGINIFNRNDIGFIDAFAKQFTSDQLYDTLLSNPFDDHFVIQQRLKNHLELVHLTDNQFLQTVRIITFFGGNNQCHILHAHLKLITGKKVVDNFEHGLSGNIEAKVSIGDGFLKPAVTMTLDGSGIKTITKHPKTGVFFERFQLPLWD